MNRYIDADAWLKDIECTNKFLDTLKHKIADAPTIDIVRCKECYMCDEEMWCSFFDSIMESDDFCSYGERSSE